MTPSEALDINSEFRAVLSGPQPTKTIRLTQRQLLILAAALDCAPLARDRDRNPLSRKLQRAIQKPIDRANKQR